MYLFCFLVSQRLLWKFVSNVCSQFFLHYYVDTLNDRKKKTQNKLIRCMWNTKWVLSIGSFQSLCWFQKKKRNDNKRKLSKIKRKTAIENEWIFRRKKALHIRTHSFNKRIIVVKEIQKTKPKQNKKRIETKGKNATKKRKRNKKTVRAAAPSRKICIKNRITLAGKRSNNNKKWIFEDRHRSLYLDDHFNKKNINNKKLKPWLWSQ